MSWRGEGGLLAGSLRTVLQMNAIDRGERRVGTHRTCGRTYLYPAAEYPLPSLIFPTPSPSSTSQRNPRSKALIPFLVSTTYSKSPYHINPPACTATALKSSSADGSTSRTCRYFFETRSTKLTRTLEPDWYQLTSQAEWPSYVPLPSASPELVIPCGVHLVVVESPLFQE